MNEKELERLADAISEQIVKALMPVRNELQNGKSGRPEKIALQQRLITAEIVEQAAARGNKFISVQPKAIVTPLARDFLRDNGIELRLASGENTSNTRAYSNRDAIIGMLAGSSTETEKRIITEAIQMHGLGIIEMKPKHRTPSAFDAAFRMLTRDLSQQKLLAGVIMDESAFALKVQAQKFTNVRPVMDWEVGAQGFCPKSHESNLILINNRMLGFTKLEKIIEDWLTSLKPKEKR